MMLGKHIVKIDGYNPHDDIKLGYKSIDPPLYVHVDNMIWGIIEDTISEVYNDFEYGDVFR